MLLESFHNKLKTVYMGRRPKKRHEKGTLISDDCVLKCSSSQYTMKSQSKDLTYKVDILQDTCKEIFCSHLCINPACVGLCAHLYKCSCNDKVNPCKHIHKLQSFLMRTKKNYLKEFSVVSGWSDDEKATNHFLCFCVLAFFEFRVYFILFLYS